MNLPNRLSLIRIALVPVLCLLLELESLPLNYLYAAIVYAVAALTDFLDGYIARKHGLITTLGKFLDPVADKLLTSAAFIYMLATGYTNAVVIVLIFSREFAVTAFRAVSAGKGEVIAAKLAGKVKTVLQIVVTLLWFVFMISEQLGYPLPFAHVLIDAFMWLVAIVTVATGIEYIYKGRENLKED